MTEEEPDADLIQRLYSIGDGALIHDAKSIVGMIRSEHALQKKGRESKIVFFRVLAGEFMRLRNYKEAQKSTHKLLEPR